MQRASLEALDKHLAAAEASCSKLELMIAEDEAHARAAAPELQRIENELDLTQSKLLHLQEMRRPKKGIISGLFGLTEMPPEILSQITSLEAKQASLRNKVWSLRRMGHNVPAFKKSLESTHILVTKLKEAIARKRRKKETELELRAAAAANQTQTRTVGSSIKRKLIKQPWCPYCGNTLGSDPHADHIYPVSKGGRSVPRNMVYVCATCNGMKRDLTLTGFMRKYGLDRATIEARLEQLGKEF